MEVLVRDARGLPEDAYLSLRVGDARRQRRFARGDRFVFEKCDTSFFAVDVFQKVGSKRVPLSELAHISAGSGTASRRGRNAGAGRDSEPNDVNVIEVPCIGGGTMQIDLSVAISDEDTGRQMVNARRQSRLQSALETSRYLEKHGVSNVLSGMLHGLIASQPEKPVAFMACHLNEQSAPPLAPADKHSIVCDLTEPAGQAQPERRFSRKTADNALPVRDHVACQNPNAMPPAKPDLTSQAQSASLTGEGCSDGAKIIHDVGTLECEDPQALPQGKPEVSMPKDVEGQAGGVLGGGFSLNGNDATLVCQDAKATPPSANAESAPQSQPEDQFGSKPGEAFISGSAVTVACQDPNAAPQAKPKATPPTRPNSRPPLGRPPPPPPQAKGPPKSKAMPFRAAAPPNGAGGGDLLSALDKQRARLKAAPPAGTRSNTAPPRLATRDPEELRREAVERADLAETLRAAAGLTSLGVVAPDHVTAPGQRLGQGRFASVMPATAPAPDSETRVPVAAKRFASSRAEDGATAVGCDSVIVPMSAMRSAKREVEALQAVSRHPNVVDLLGIVVPPAEGYGGEEPPLQLLLACWDRSLFGLLADAEAWVALGRLGRLSILVDVAKGLDALHNAGIAHLDVKSHNVLVNGTPGLPGSSITACLCDLGAMHMCGPDSGDPACEGTSGWTAPEILEPPLGSVQRADPRTADVFSFGVVIWEVVSDPGTSNPLCGLAGEEYCAAVAIGRRPDFSAEAAELGEAALAAECWRFEPESRPQLDSINSSLCELIATLASKQ